MMAPIKLTPVAITTPPSQPGVTVSPALNDPAVKAASFSDLLRASASAEGLIKQLNGSTPAAERWESLASDSTRSSGVTESTLVNLPATDGQGAEEVGDQASAATAGNPSELSVDEFLAIVNPLVVNADGHTPSTSASLPGGTAAKLQPTADSAAHPDTATPVSVLTAAQAKLQPTADSAAHPDTATPVSVLTAAQAKPQLTADSAAHPDTATPVSVLTAAQAKLQPTADLASLPKTESAPAAMASVQSVTASSYELKLTPEAASAVASDQLKTANTNLNPTTHPAAALELIQRATPDAPAATTVSASAAQHPSTQTGLSDQTLVIGQPLSQNDAKNETTAAANAVSALKHLQSLHISQDISQNFSLAPEMAGADPALPGQSQETDLVAQETMRPGLAAEVDADTALPSSSDRLAPLSYSVTRTPGGADTIASPLRLDTALTLQQGNWDKPLGQQLLWMAQNQTQHAELRVDPPQLGPVEVRLSLHDDQASVTFISHDAAVRDAIENALPRLRELFDGQGMQLNQANVSDQPLPRHPSGAGEHTARQGNGPRGETTGDADTADQPELVEPSRRQAGMVDHYI